MSTSGTLILLGVLIVIFPYFGLPHAWSDFFVAIFGIIVVAIGFSLRNRAVKVAEQGPAAPEQHEPPAIA